MRFFPWFEAADSGSSHGDRLPQSLKLDDWGLRLRTPKDRARAFMKFLAPNDDEGRLKPARWRGRVPDELAAAAEANNGILTREQVIVFYEKHHPYISLESRQLFLAPAVIEAAQQAELALRSNGDGPRPTALPILVYLVDTLATGSLSMPYVVVVGVDESKLPGHKFAGAWLGDKGMLLALPAGTKGAGSDADVTYYELDEHHHLEKQHASFHVVDTILLEGAADDADLTPEFPGITDKLETLVDFPLRGLDLTNYMPAPLPPGPDSARMNGITSSEDPRTQLPPYRYDLYAVTNHFGSLSSGHCMSN